MKFSCFKMANEVVVDTSSDMSPSTNAKTTFWKEETEKLISLWSEEEVLFNCRHKEYFSGVELHAMFECFMVKMSCACKLTEVMSQACRKLVVCDKVVPCKSPLSVHMRPHIVNEKTYTPLVKRCFSALYGLLFVSLASGLSNFRVLRSLCTTK